MRVAKYAFEATQVMKYQVHTVIIFLGMEFIAPQLRACVEFWQNGVVKLYTRHDVFGPDRGCLVFLLFIQLISSGPYKMPLCTRVVCRGNVQPGTSLKNRRKRIERKSALRKMFPPDESRAMSSTKILPFYSELNTPE